MDGSQMSRERSGDGPAIKKINLALQGGGSHGAFTWGILDRLLEETRLEFEGVTGASAGAMNAVVLASGYAKGGREGAREALREFWYEISNAAWASPMRRSWMGKMRGSWSLDDSPGYLWVDMMSRLLSPYETNPMDINPLRKTLWQLVDFEAVRDCSEIKLFISATNVRNGRVRVFHQDELDIPHVMASACLPFMFKAVEIEGEAYWDGGFMGNPPLYPLFDHCETDDVIIVQINPFERVEIPTSARSIQNRLNEITFNASLMRELRAIDFVTRLLDEGRLEGTGYRRVLVHLIGDEPMMSTLGASSKMNAEKAFLDMLFEQGRNIAAKWIDAHFGQIGNESTFSIGGVFGEETDPLDGERISRDAKYRVKP